MKALAIWAVAMSLTAHAANAVDCSEVMHNDTGYVVCQVDASNETLALFLRDDEGRIYGQFSNIDTALNEKGAQLAFAMNAGMYHEDRSPVGHYLESGVEIRRVIASAGPGNFGLLPNGVFCVSEGRADVYETKRYLEAAPDCSYATQSGPMLVIDGALHPRFLEDGTSKFIRNGVGTTADGQTAYFVISNNPVNFHTFGTFFRDHLALETALYFDGKVSRLFAPSIGRRDFGFALGPIIGVVEPRP